MNLKNILLSERNKTPNPYILGFYLYRKHPEKRDESRSMAACLGVGTKLVWGDFGEWQLYKSITIKELYTYDGWITVCKLHLNKTLFLKSTCKKKVYSSFLHLNSNWNYKWPSKKNRWVNGGIIKQWNTSYYNSHRQEHTETHNMHEPQALCWQKTHLFCFAIVYCISFIKSLFVVWRQTWNQAHLCPEVCMCVSIWKS